MQPLRGYDDVPGRHCKFSGERANGCPLSQRGMPLLREGMKKVAGRAKPIRKTRRGGQKPREVDAVDLGKNKFRSGVRRSVQ